MMKKHSYPSSKASMANLILNHRTSSMFPKKTKLVFLNKMTPHTKGDNWIPRNFVVKLVVGEVYLIRKNVLLT